MMKLSAYMAVYKTPYAYSFMTNFEVCVCKIFLLCYGYHIINSFDFFLLIKEHFLKIPRVEWDTFHINFDLFLFHSVEMV